MYRRLGEMEPDLMFCRSTRREKNGSLRSRPQHSLERLHSLRLETKLSLRKHFQINSACTDCLTFEKRPGYSNLLAPSKRIVVSTQYHSSVTSRNSRLGQAHRA